jgi:hypothetical protein
VRERERSFKIPPQHTMRTKTPTLKKNLKDNNRLETDGNNFDKFLEIDFI